MCTLAIYMQVFSRFPVVVAANRDEYMNRPALPPTMLAPRPRVVGGKDLQAGGTWLGLNEHGLIAGLLNRHTGTPSRNGVRSRGLLCLDALRESSLAAARAFVSRCDGDNYNPFNLLVASREGAFVAYNRMGAVEFTALSPGLHLLTNLDLDDFECPRISGAFDHFSRLMTDLAIANHSDRMLTALRRLLGDHSTQLDSRAALPNALCMHNNGYGTRSSSVIMLGRKPSEMLHFFADGPPCCTPYRPAITPGAEINAEKLPDI